MIPEIFHDFTKSLLKDDYLLSKGQRVRTCNSEPYNMY